MTCDGIDTTVYGEWKNLGKISTEVVNIDIYPFTLCDESDSLTEKH
jgi:hypothetical protein